MQDRLRLRAETRLGHAAAIGVPGAFALAVGGGLLYAAAFPPLSWAPAAWLALAPLLVASAALPPRRAAIAGLCFTATAGAGLTWFLPHMLSQYFGLGALPSVLASAAIVLGQHGPFVAGYAAWVSWLARRRAANPPLLAAGWLACELARAHGLANPWGLLAYSQVGWTSLIQVADLAGPYGIGLVVAAVNAGAAAVVMPALRGRRPMGSAATIAIALAATLLYGEWRLAQSFDDGPGVRVAIVQGGAPSAEPAARAARLARYASLTREGVLPQTRLVVWPEYAVEAYLEEASADRETVLRTAAATGADLVLGGPRWEPSASGTHYYNSAYLVRDGRIAARYDKHRLVPFAEGSYTAGTGSFVLPTSDLRAAPLICVEAMFPDVVRRAVREGADALLVLSNDAWFGSAAAARQQLDMATLRAVETRRHLVRAASKGFSAVIDPHGRTLTQGAFDAHRVLDATVHASRARTPYTRWGDAFAWLAIAGVAVATLRSVFAQTNRR